MPMPETVMYKDRFLTSWQNQIWRSWKVTTVKPKAIAERMCGPSRSDLRAGVSGANPGHDRRSLWCRCVFARSV